jgi:hypothetical protein
MGRTSRLDRVPRYAQIVRYLSEEWLSAADRAVRDASPAPSGALVIDQHIDDEGTALCWRTTLGLQSRIERIAPESTGADAVFRQSYATARAIAQGSSDAHQAFLLGDIRFEGSIDALITHRGSFEWLEQALAPVMAATSWE